MGRSPDYVDAPEYDGDECAQMRRALEAQRDLIAAVSHEMRTPLTPLKGFLSMLLRPQFRMSEDGLREIHGRMLRQVLRLERLVEDLLTTSYVDAGRFVTALEPVPVDAVLERLLADYARPWSLEGGGPDAIVLADPGRLDQVVSNLLSNADKYSPPGCPVRISVEHAPDHEPPELIVRVIDQGHGIPEHNRERVFDRFHRLIDDDGPRDGSGLGLYIARKLVESMGGRIWVEGEPGHGSTFAFSLPAAVAPLLVR